MLKLMGLRGNSAGILTAHEAAGVGRGSVGPVGSFTFILGEQRESLEFHLGENMTRGPF